MLHHILTHLLLKSDVIEHTISPKYDDFKQRGTERLANPAWQFL